MNLIRRSWVEQLKIKAGGSLYPTSKETVEKNGISLQTERLFKSVSEMANGTEHYNKK